MKKGDMSKTLAIPLPLKGDWSKTASVIPKMQVIITTKPTNSKVFKTDGHIAGSVRKNS